ncbi:ATP-binding protein [Streptomyces sp. NPDC001553]|uniref:ATP-binding protein n=1 Tax=Streptomyces sp. NPDC001553 TaxID=3154385 RepID=UPI00331777FC
MSIAALPLFNARALDAMSRTGRRTDDLMECTFPVEGAVGEPLADVDARRVSHMRRIVVARLRYLGLVFLLDVAEQIVSELVTNAVKHGGGEVTLSMRVTRAAVRLMVRDSGSGQPQPIDPGPEAEGGRGLLIVHLLADERGGESGFDPKTRTAWCSLPLSQDCP